MRASLIPKWLQEFEKEARYTVKGKKLFFETTKNWFVHWVNRHWTHERDDEGDFGFRATLHIGIGIVIGLLVIVHWALTLAMAYLFYKYERNEDVHTVDQAWKDLYGALIGLPIGAIIAFILV